MFPKVRLFHLGRKFRMVPPDLEYLEGHSFHSVPPGRLYLEDLMCRLVLEPLLAPIYHLGLLYLTVHLFR